MATAYEELVAAAEALGEVGGILRYSIGGAGGSEGSALDLKTAAESSSLSAAQLRMLAANIRNVAVERQRAKDLGLLEDYNLLGIAVEFGAGSFYSELIMRTQGG